MVEILKYIEEIKDLLYSKFIFTLKITFWRFFSTTETKKKKKKQKTKQSENVHDLKNRQEK